MTTRNDPAQDRSEMAIRKYTQNIPSGRRARSVKYMRELIATYGPVVDRYPIWHPFVTCSPWEGRMMGALPRTEPGEACGYAGLDHVLLLRDAFLTCPYGECEREVTTRSVNDLIPHSIADVAPHLLDDDVALYQIGTHPLLIQLEWLVPLDPGGYIPTRFAIPLMLEQELPNWTTAKVAETWADMRELFLGIGHHGGPSPFVSQETEREMEHVWNTLVRTGMFGR